MIPDTMKDSRSFLVVGFRAIILVILVYTIVLGFAYIFLKEGIFILIGSFIGTVISVIVSLLFIRRG